MNIQKRILSAAVITALGVASLPAAQAIGMNNGDYILYINITPLTISGTPRFGKNGAWNSSFTFGGNAPGTGTNWMTDDAGTVTGSDGTPRGSGIASDGYAGRIAISVSNNIVAITSFSKDVIYNTAGGPFVQYYGTGYDAIPNTPIPSTACGVVDSATGKLDIAPTSRLGAIGQPGLTHHFNRRWNVDNVDCSPVCTNNGTTTWVPFTTGTISNGQTAITGAALASLGDVNLDGFADYSAILVTGSEIGDDWGSFTGAKFFEVWNVRILSVDNSPAVALGSCTVGSISVTVDKADLSGTLASFEPGVSGCSLSGSHVNASEGGAWALLLGFLAWLKALTWRRKRDSSRN